MSGWFSFPGAPGDRTFEQQMTGLRPWLADLCRGKSILDFGCAEGLIGIEMLRHGAVHVHGIELVPERVKHARQLARGFASLYEVGDANDWRPSKEYDVTLALAILHKLRDPSAVAKRLAMHTREHLVVRLPPAGAVIVDVRSNRVPHDITATVREHGFALERATNDGPLGEWIGVYRRT